MVADLAFTDLAHALIAHRKRLRYRTHFPACAAVGQVVLKVPIFVDVTSAIVIAAVTYFVLRTAHRIDAAIRGDAAIAFWAIAKAVWVNAATKADNSKPREGGRVGQSSPGKAHSAKATASRQSQQPSDQQKPKRCGRRVLRDCARGTPSTCGKAPVWRGSCGIEGAGAGRANCARGAIDVCARVVDAGRSLTDASVAARTTTVVDHARAFDAAAFGSAATTRRRLAFALLTRLTARTCIWTSRDALTLAAVFLFVA